MYGNASDNYENAHKNENKSIILKQIENWYEGKEDFLNKGIADQYRDKIDVSTGFCGDRGRYNGGGYEKQSTRYAAEGRLNNTRSQKPIFTCSNPTRDLYTMPNEEEKGNQALPVPVGLITADEEVYAGGFYASYNKEYWLYTGASYWTITPFYFSTYITIFYLTSDGYLHQDPTQNSHGIRPVINLKADTQFEVGGDGTSDKPFTVSLQ